MAPPPSRETKWVIRETWLTRKPRPGSFSLAALSTLTLIAGTLLYWSGLLGADKWMPASPDSVFKQGELWRLWTTIFAHADTGHIAANSLLFYILAFFLYGYFGPFIFPLSALFWGGIANLIVLLSYNAETTLIGASGVVYWMGGTWLVLYYFLSRQKNLFHRWLRTTGVGLLLFAPQSFEPQVSYRAHLAGFVLGLIAGGWHFWRNRELFRSAEVREIEIDEDLDPGDELPPPEGLPT